MSDVIQIIAGVFFLILVFILTRYGMAWRIRRACMFILRDLENREALDPDSAVELLYAKRDFLRIGLRDFRPKALQDMVQGGLIGMTAEGKYYLKRRLRDLQR